MPWLNNPWVVGIGGGILSGILVALLSRYLFSKRDNREYLQKVVAANREVIYAIRPGVSEGVIPSNDVVKSLIKSTARKYGVDLKDVYEPPEIAEELIKEVMDSSFIPSSAKADYCSKVAALTKPEQVPDQAATAKEGAQMKSTSLTDYRQRMITVMSTTLGLVAATMTVVFTINRTGVESLPDKFAVILPTLIAMLVITVAMALYAGYRGNEMRLRAKEREALLLESDRKRGKKD